MNIEQRYVPWKCRKDYGRERKVALFVEFDDDGNYCGVRCNGCEESNASVECLSCIAAVEKHFSE